MKFGANLQTIITPNWRVQYVEYETLKEVIYRYEEPLKLEENEEAREILKEQLTAKFMSKCEHELNKVNNFYAEKLAEATRKHSHLQEQYEVYKETVQPKATSLLRTNSRVGVIDEPNVFFLKRKEHKNLKELKTAFSEHYLFLVILQNFQELNFTAFRKILKKFDKVLKTKSGAEWREDYVESAAFYTDNLVNEYIKETEDTYIDLEGGDRSKAMARLRVPPLMQASGEGQYNTFKIGLYTGIAIILFIVFVHGVVHALPQQSLSPQGFYHEFISFYRSSLLIALFTAYIGTNILVWRTFGINHVLIFELDPRSHSSYRHFYEIAALIASLTFLSMVSHIYRDYNILPGFSPGILYIVIAVFLFNPLPFLFHNARRWLLRRMWRLLCAGYYKVEFADFWLADQFSSMIGLAVDAEFLICYYSSIVSTGSNNDEFKTCSPYSIVLQSLTVCFPAWIRFAQCIRRYRDTGKGWPHLANAGKYSTRFWKQLFRALYVTHRTTPFFVLWITVQLISTCYSLFWDYKMDWGLFKPDAGKNRFLRKELIYRSKYIYYAAVIQNTTVRFLWVPLIALEQTGNRLSYRILRDITTFLSCTRRFIWNFFRLENEHVNNIGGFRAVRDISVTPFERENDQRKTQQDKSDGAESQILDFRGKNRKTINYNVFGDNTENKTGEVVAEVQSGEVTIEL